MAVRIKKQSDVIYAEVGFFFLISSTKLSFYFIIFSVDAFLMDPLA